MLADQPCVCDAKGLEGVKACAPHTRVNVMLRDLPGLGVWRVESTGVNAAAELAGVVQLCSEATARGRLLPAKLRLEHRSSLGAPGEPAKHFAVPVLDVALSAAQLGLVLGTAPMPELATPLSSQPGIGTAVAALEAPVLEPAIEPEPTPPAPRGLRPVPDTVPEAPAPSISEQLGNAFTPKARRSNAAAPIPPTGAPVRGVADMTGEPAGPDAPSDSGHTAETGSRPGPGDDPGPEISGEDGPGTSAHPITTDEGNARPAGGASSPDQNSTELVDTEGAQKVATWCREVGIGDQTRGRFLGAASGGRYWSAHEVPVDDLDVLRGLCLALYHGTVSFKVVDDERGLIVTNAGEIVTIGDDLSETRPMPPGVFWKERVAATRGVGSTKFVRAARDAAARLRLELPTGYDTMPDDDRLRREMLRWLAAAG